MASKLLTPVITLLICGIIYFTNGFAAFSGATLDVLFQIRGERETSQSIVIVGVDEDSLDKLGAWPFSRELHGSLVQKLSLAKAIGFDFLFSDVTKNDALFNESIKLKPPIVFTAASDYKGEIQSPAITLYNFYGYGHIDSILGYGGVVRKTRLLPQQHLQAFSLVLLEAADSPVNLTNLYQPRLINFYGPEFTFLYLSYYDVLNGHIPAQFFKDRFVLIGAQSVALGDVHVTPFTDKHPTPGVEIQATILNNLLENSFLHELTFLSWGVAACFLLLAVFLWPTFSERQNILLNITAFILLPGASILLFFNNYFFDPFIPLLVLLLSYLVHLCLQGLWLTRKLVFEVSQLNHELKTGLNATYTNIPHQLLPPAGKRAHSHSTGGFRRYFNRLHDGIAALSLQNQFINHLLKEEVDPLILWDRTNSNVILANTMFNLFWHQHFPTIKDLPDLPQFLEEINHHALSSETAIPLTANTLDLDGSSLTIDITVLHSGRKHYFQVKIHGVQTAHSRFSGVLANITDVTDIHELEKMKSDLLGVVSHELKLPLTTILGYSEMLIDTLENEPKQFVREIRNQTERLNQLIENFLDLARIESGKYQIRTFPLDIAIITLDSINAVSPVADKKQITILSEIPSKVSPLIGDEPLLLQGFINLLDNAIKFSPAGSTIRLKLTEEKERFCLNISDQGAGIPREDQDRIFEKFNRGSNLGSQEGVGLGLSLVKQVIDNHGGTISLESSAGRGTTFKILLPKDHFSKDN